MSRTSEKSVPKYCRQKEKGRADRAVVYIDGKRRVLGTYGSEESREKYRKLVFGESDDDDGEGVATATPPAIEPGTDPTVSQLIVAYLDFAAEFYRKPDGKQRNEYHASSLALGFVRRHSGDCLASEFGPRKLREVRQLMIDEKLSRVYINDQVRRIIRAFKWATSEELIEPSVFQALKTLEGLRKGRTTAKDSKQRKPVSESVVEATIKHLPDVVADMVVVQRHTGMRSGELIQMRPCDIDRSGDVWLYTPRQFKSAHHGKSRVVAIGPRAQAVLLRYLARADDMHLFRPCDSEEKRLAEREANRETPPSCGNTRGSNRKANPKTVPGGAYTKDTYARAVTRAAKKAKVEHWTPHRLRHSAATEMRRVFGLEHTQAALGHAHAAITEVYAASDQAKAAEVARKIG